MTDKLSDDNSQGDLFPTDDFTKKAEDKKKNIAPEDEDRDKDNDKDGDSGIHSFLDQLREAFASGNVQVETFPPFPAKRSKKQKAAEKNEENDKLNKIKAFNYTPVEIRDYLNRFVISQEEAKRVLAVAICDHYNYIKRCMNDPELDALEHAKHNVLMMGPTGVGKTYVMRCLAKLVGVPFIKADATKYSETGYVGYDVEDIIRDLVKAANGNVKLAQYGIVYIDEIDKIAGRGIDGGKDVNGRGVQVNLLKLMEDSEVKVVAQTDMMAQMRSAMSGNDQPETIRTKNILFIVSGAFVQLGDIIGKRLGKTHIGFGKDTAACTMENSSELMKQLQTRDLVDFGLEPEFVGRLPVRVALNDLNTKDLENVLSSVENGFLKQYEDAFLGYGININIDNSAISEIAKRAALEKTGARGLLTILERTFRNFKFELPGTDVKQISVNAETIIDPDKALQDIIDAQTQNTLNANRRKIATFISSFEFKNNLRLSFTEDAVNKVMALAAEKGDDIVDYCSDVLQPLAMGLELVQRKEPDAAITIDAEFFNNPSDALADLIKKSCSDT